MHIEQTWIYWCTISLLSLWGGWQKWKHTRSVVRWREEEMKRMIAEERSGRLFGMESALKEKTEEILQLRLQLTAKEAASSEKNRHHQEKMEMLDQAQEKLTHTFKAISADALQQNVCSFLELATARFEQLQQRMEQEWVHRQKTTDQMMQPLQSTLKELENARLVAYTAVHEQLSHIHKMHSHLQTETANLVKALRTPQVRGRWGETQLRRVVELAGMVEHCDFREQESVASEEGLLRPDMVIQLPQNKQVVIDAKAPLQAYLTAIECQDDGERKKKFKEHAKQIRGHISQLAAKSYWEQFPSTPEFVVLFLPSESIFGAALEQDPDLLDWGVAQKIMLVTPTTLIALLKSVAYSWGRAAIAENAEKISVLGKTLCDRLTTLVFHFDDIKKGLDRAVEAYNKSVGSFESRILPVARKFKEYGIPGDEEALSLELLDKTTRPVVQAGS